MIKCTKCLQEKENHLFNKNKSHTNGLQSYCKECAKKVRVSYRTKYPWKMTRRWILIRCYNPKSHAYRNYGRKGVKNFLTNDDLEMIWKRDGASKMKKPSIDRRDPLGDYTVENCRYIEYSENSAKKHWTYEMRRDLALRSIRERRQQHL